MHLSGAELKAYLLVQRSIQKDRRHGEVSARWLARIVGITEGYACEVLQRLCEIGLIGANKRPRRTTTYTCPIAWKQPPDRSTPVEHRDFPGPIPGNADRSTLLEHPLAINLPGSRTARPEFVLQLEERA
jgi:hypothetical protein